MMNRMICTFSTAVMLTLFCTNSFAQTPDTVIIESEFKAQQIGKNCFHRIGNDFKKYDNASGEWAAVNTSNFRLSPYTVHWIFAVIKNSGPFDRTIKLYLNNVQAGVTKLYVVSNGHIDSSKQTGSLLPVSHRASQDRQLSIPFIIHAGTTTEIYLKTSRREIGITLTPVLQDTFFSVASVWPDYILVIALSFILLITLVSVIVLVYFPSKEAFWFFLYTFFGFFYVLAVSGFGSLYLWSTSPWFEENAAVFLGSISTSAFFEFSRRIFQVRINHKFINVLLLFFSISYVATGVLGFGVPLNLLEPGFYASVIQFPYLLLLLCFIVVLCLSVHEAVIKKRKEFWWFVSIFSSYILMAVIMLMLEVGYIRYDHQMHAFLLAFGALPQMTLTLSFLISRILHLLKKKTLEIAATKAEGDQALLKERLRVSRDLHDEVGATLSGISMYSHLTKEQIKNSNIAEVEKSLNTIQQSAGEMVNKLSDIVWLVNPKQDSVEKLIQRLEEYARGMAMIKNIQFRVNLPGHLAEHSLPVESRRNIYLFCKEAINNAVKYSNGTLLELSIKKTNGMLEFSVSDNGTGFNETTVRSGNGLENMQKRADEIGAKFTIESKANEGVLVSIQSRIL